MKYHLILGRSLSFTFIASLSPVRHVGRFCLNLSIAHYNTLNRPRTCPSHSLVFIQFSIILRKIPSKSADSNESSCAISKHCEWRCECDCDCVCVYCYLFVSIPYPLPHMYFQLVSCPFRLRLVILSFRFIGKQLLVFFVSFRSLAFWLYARWHSVRFRCFFSSPLCVRTFHNRRYSRYVLRLV